MRFVHHQIMFSDLTITISEITQTISEITQFYSESDFSPHQRGSVVGYNSSLCMRLYPNLLSGSALSRMVPGMYDSLQQYPTEYSCGNTVISPRFSG